MVFLFLRLFSLSSSYISQEPSYIDSASLLLFLSSFLHLLHLGAFESVISYKPKKVRPIPTQAQAMEALGSAAVILAVSA